MAETGKKPDTRVSVAPTNDPSPQPESPTTKREDVKEDASGYLCVKTRYPHSTFSVEGVPTINVEGVVLTREQADKVTGLAPKYGVGLDVEEVK